MYHTVNVRPEISKLLQGNTSRYGHNQGLSRKDSNNSRTYRMNRQMKLYEIKDFYKPKKTTEQRCSIHKGRTYLPDIHLKGH